MTLEEKFKQDMHGGREIEGMIRINAHYQGQEDDGSTFIKFENGNYYLFDDVKIAKHIDGQDEYFIND